MSERLAQVEQASRHVAFAGISESAALANEALKFCGRALVAETILPLASRQSDCSPSHISRRPSSIEPSDASNRARANPAHRLDRDGRG